MKDAVDLIGKNVTYMDKTWVISKVFFIPSAVSSKHDFYFGLKSLNNNMLNVSYVELLPHLKHQIKL